MLKKLMLSFVFASVLPGVLFSFVPQQNNGNNLHTPSAPTTQTVRLPQINVELNAGQEQEPMYISVMENDGTVSDMELEKYIWGVVLGEMPASFEPEALKAQAVAARTYALRCMIDQVHDGGAVCKKHSCCQNYCDPAQYVKSEDMQEYAQKVWEAVEQTRGIIATYGSKPIFAVYFASSGGSTEDAEEVWGRPFPYLKSVDSPGESDKSYQNDTISLTFSQFQRTLGVQLHGTAEQWIGKTRYTAGGGVDSVMIGGNEYTGVQLRWLFGLRSTMFRITVSNDMITFTTNGYGHRVGLSQYGAQAMAVDGYDYSEILIHYYQNIELRKYPVDND